MWGIIHQHARPGNCRGNVLGFFLVAAVTLAGLALSAGFSGCTHDQVQTAQTIAVQVPQPSDAAAATIRARVALAVKAYVGAHPATSAWANEAAKVCFAISGAALPDPAVLRTLFSAAEIYAPASVDGLLSDVLALYQRDYPLVASAQGASKNYLTLLGEGIQDGVKAAAVGEAP